MIVFLENLTSNTAPQYFKQKRLVGASDKPFLVSLKLITDV